MKLIRVPALILAFLLPLCFVGQNQPNSRVSRDRAASAEVEVVAYDTYGHFLGTPTVKLFESEDHKNIATKFQRGTAEGVPLGVYRVEAYRPGFYSQARYVRVYQPRVTIILGLEPGHEASPTPLRLHGRVIGEPMPSTKRIFIKLSGIFSDVSLESVIGPDGGFDLAGMPWGAYRVLVVSEDGILGSRIITVPYDGPPLQIEVGHDRAVPAP
jgi:hypothetical protein